MSDEKSGPRPRSEGKRRGRAHKARDIMLVHGVNETGDKYAVLRAREDRIEAGVVQPLKEGAPIEGEVLKLRRREESPLLYDVDVEVPRGALTAPGGSEGRKKGPAQVASASYRTNWDTIWKSRAESKKPLLN